MTAIGVIPARGGSQRLPGKNLLSVLGKPLIAYTIEAALHASLLSRVLVSTDHPEIAKVARRFGAEVVIRPEELATADAPIDDSLRHVVKHLRTNGDSPIDIVVLMQANNPIRKKGEIDEVVRRVIASPSATAVATAFKISQRPEWTKKVINEETMEIGPFLDPGTKYRMQDLPDLYLLDGSIMAIRADVLEKTAGDRRVHAYLGDRVIILAHESKYAVEIDDSEDVELAEFYLSRQRGA